MALGGALAILFIIFILPEIRSSQTPLPPGAEGALTIVFASLLAVVLPGEVLAKIKRRTRSAQASLPPADDTVPPPPPPPPDGGAQ